MRERFGRLRTSTVIAATLALVVTGVAAGAAGDFMVLGSGNNSGTSQTVLLNVGLGAAFTLKTTNPSTNAAGIFGWSSSTAGNATRGVYGRADGPNSFGVYALQNGAAGNGAALLADGGQNLGIYAVSDSEDAIVGEALGCTGFLCGRAGVWGYGVGLSGGVVGQGPLGVLGIDDLEGGGFGFYTSDDAYIGGDLEVNGACTGCTLATLATNGGGSTLSRGDAVTALGVTTDADGNVLVKVGPAAAGDAVFGIVDSAVEGVASGTTEAQRTAYKNAGSSAPAGGTMRIVTAGIVTYAAADGSGGAIAAGDTLSVSTSGARLSKAAASTAPALTVGVALGTLKDGRVVVYLD